MPIFNVEYAPLLPPKNIRCHILSDCGANHSLAIPEPDRAFDGLGSEGHNMLPDHSEFK